MVTVLFLDAVGTLFRVRGSVGEIYSQVAAEYGIHVDPQQLNPAFERAMAQAPVPASPGLTGSQLLKWERDWWQQVVRNTFAQAGEHTQDPLEAWFPHFQAFFEELFDLFGRGEPWELYPETLPVLQALQEQGIRLGIISNFDSRLLPLLKHLGLEGYFSSVTLSTQVGAAKPDAKIFQAALQAQGIPPQQAMHIGDSYSQDYLGAKAAGLHALWLDRRLSSASQGEFQERTSDLWGSLSALPRD